VGRRPPGVPLDAAHPGGRRIGTLPGRLDATVEAIAFRSISELIANVRTHAEAQQVAISLSADDGRL
jgi:signal transduction histidine kinase